MYDDVVRAMLLTWRDLERRLPQPRETQARLTYREMRYRAKQVAIELARRGHEVP